MRREYLVGAWVVFVAQTASLSVSTRIVASRDEFSDCGCVRSTSRSMAAIPTRCGWVFDHRRGPFWLRLCRAALYRRMPSCRTTPWPGRRNTAKALPICNRRYGRLYDCAIISRHAGHRIQTDPSPHPSPLGGEKVPVGRVRGILPVPRFLPGYIAMSSARYLPHFGAGGPLVRHASCFVLLLAIARAENGTAPTQTAPDADLFTNSSVRRIRIEIRPEDVRALRKESRSYVRSAIYAEDEFYPEVGVHLKGSTGSFRGLDDKPGLTLDFGRFSSGQRFHGLRKIHLNNSVEDPSYLNEQIASELFRAAEVPAPRVTHALVELNGRKLGLYVLKEGFTEDFLGIYFKRVDGNLYDTDLGDAVDQRRTRQSGRDPGDEHAGLELLAEAALEPELNRRWQRLNAALDMDRFITFMALEVMACHRDGYTLARNNFRLYHDPDAKKVVFFPHGMDQLFGRADLPWKPHMAGLLARSVMETAEGRQEYQARFGALFTSLFIVDRLASRVNQIVGALRPFLGNSEL